MNHLHPESKKEDTHGLHDLCCSESKPETEVKAVTEVASSVPKEKKSRFLGICMIIASVILAGTYLLAPRLNVANGIALSEKAMAALEKSVLPAKGVTLPVVWGDIGKQLLDNGTIDQKKFEELYAQRGGLDDATKKLLSGTGNGKLVITKDNANAVLNLLWALGLSNKNEILEKGPMVDKRYGGAQNFASTGGWTLSVGSPMNHYSHHSMVPLTADQQALVNNVSKNIYRPCCGNATYFPDCNHGMAMLGLLELMASQNVSEADMYKAALAVNSYWFPDTYVTIAHYLKTKGIEWKDASPQGILSAEFSSASGFQQVKSQVAPVPQKGGNSCGV